MNNIGHGNLNIGGIKAIISDLDGKRVFGIPYSLTKIPAYQRRVLSEGKCQGFLPVKFLFMDGVLWAYYEFDGYIQIRHIGKAITVKDSCLALKLCRLLHSVVYSVLDGENYLFTGEDIYLSLDTVFIHPPTFQVGIAYIPGIKKDISLRDNLVEFIRETENLFRDDEWMAYANQICRHIVSNNLGIARIAEYLCEISHEIYSLGSPEKELERVEQTVDDDSKAGEEGIMKQLLEYISKFSFK